MKRLQRDQEKELASQSRLLCAWTQWHAEQLAEALVGPHRDAVANVISVLESLGMDSAAELLGRVQRTEWSTVSDNVRGMVLHQINQSIIRLRERNGMAGLDDPLPGQPDNVFRRIKQTLFAPPPHGAHPGSNPTKQRNDER
jgi:hypothetical protein